MDFVGVNPLCSQKPYATIVNGLQEFISGTSKIVDSLTTELMT